MHAYVHVCAYGYVIVYVHITIDLHGDVYMGICAYCSRPLLRQKLGDSDVDLAKCGIGFTCRKGLKPESPNQADG